jgi:hypothetical protein
MLHVWSSRNSRVPPPRLLGAGRGSPPSFGGSCCCPRSVSCSTRLAFFWLRRATSISPATFFLFACILPEAWARFWRALGSFPKIESTGAEPAPLARSLLFIGSRARLSRRLRHGSGIGTRSRHTFGLRNFGRDVVSHRSRSVPHHAPRKHRSSPSVDDPKLRLDLAAVTLRNQLPFMRFALDWPFPRSYITVSWLCWVPNLRIAEWMVPRRKLPSLSQSYR